MHLLSRHAIHHARCRATSRHRHGEDQIGRSVVVAVARMMAAGVGRPPPIAPRGRGTPPGSTADASDVARVAATWS